MEVKAYKTFKDLEVWQKAKNFKLDIYELIGKIPAHERFELISQLKRASRAIPSDISEGYGRYTYKDQLRFCIQARALYLNVRTI
jgi:four helix bundle protein